MLAPVGRAFSADIGTVSIPTFAYLASHRRFGFLVLSLVSCARGASARLLARFSMFSSVLWFRPEAESQLEAIHSPNMGTACSHKQPFFLSPCSTKDMRLHIANNSCLQSHRNERFTLHCQRFIRRKCDRRVKICCRLPDVGSKIVRRCSTNYHKTAALYEVLALLA